METTITPDQLCRYLESAGWTKVSKWGRIHVYKSAALLDWAKAIAKFPKELNSDSDVDLLEQALKAVAEFEHCTIEEVKARVLG